MRDSPQDVYAECLPSNRGYPLWFPEPSTTLPSSYRQDGLQIGDVGFVSRMGRFNVLFNISHDSNHALHHRPGLALNFDPIRIDIDRQVDIVVNADPPGCVITSSDIAQHNQMSQQRGHYEFTSSSTKGAILILPDGSTSHDLPGNEHFRKLAMERAFEWYEIAKMHHGENISNGSLYLITGFHKARSWSLASFHDTTISEPRHLALVSREGEAAAAGREWKCTFPVQYRDGPGPGHNGNVNQTIFISGFKIAVRDDVLRWWTPVVEPVPAFRRRKGLCRFGRYLTQLFGKKNISQQQHKPNRVADVNPVPALSQPFHPSDIINKYLLKKDPNALVAITHDSEWIALVDGRKIRLEELSEEDQFERVLSENFSLASQPENDAVYLEGKSKDERTGVVYLEGKSKNVVVSESEECWVMRPSTVNFEVVITRIRAEDVISGFNRLPVGFYVLVQFDGIKRRTKNKPVDFHDNIVEWEDRLQLPSQPSVKVQLSLYASFEFSPMLGNGELLRTAELSVGELLGNTHLIMFSVAQEKVSSPCSSLLITTEKQVVTSHQSDVSSDHSNDSNWEDSSELTRLADQGHRALLHFHVDPIKDNIAISIEHFEQALRTCSPDHPSYASVLCNLAMAYFVNSQFGNVLASSNSISLFREALKLRYVGHPDRPTTILHLAQVLIYHYGMHKFGKSVLDEIMGLASEVQAICSVDSYEHQAAGLALQTFELYRAVSSGSLTDINKLIPTIRHSVQSVPGSYFDMLQRLTNLGLVLRVRYEISSDLSNLSESIMICEESIQFAPCGHPREPVLLSNLGALLLRRFERTRDHKDLERSISCIEDAIHCTPESSFDYPVRLASLSSALIARFELHDNESSTFQWPGDSLEMIARLTQLHHPEHPAVLFILGTSRFTEYRLFGDRRNLDSAISSMEEAKQLTPSSHFAYPQMLSALSSSYFTRFNVSRRSLDLENAILNIQEAVELTQSSHFDYPMMVSALQNSFSLYIRMFSGFANLNELAGLLEEDLGVSIISTTPDDNVSRYVLLVHLFFTRIQRSDDLPSLNKTILFLERVVRRAPEGDSDRLEMLLCLGFIYRARFHKSGEVDDLDESIRVIEDALGQTTVGDALRPRILTSLGISWTMRAQKQQQQSTAHVPEPVTETNQLLDSLVIKLAETFHI